MAKKNLPHDTPVDTPAVGAIIEAADLGPDAEVLGAQLARGVETLEAAYGAWGELKAAHHNARRRWADEKKRLEEQGALLLGAIRAATPGVAKTGEEGLARSNALDTFVTEAREKLDAALSALDAQSKAAEAAFVAELGKLRAAILSRVARQAQTMRPAFRLAVRTVGAQRILHAHRLGEDESVIALYVLTGRIPTRYGYLLDDSTDDVLAAPPSLYADEGVADVRPTASGLSALLTERAEVWPVKGMLPLALPAAGWMRWISRGAVLEAEVQDGDGFRNLLTRDEAERITGLLLTHKLAGALDLELVRD
jgi:hypothetical protein